MIETIYEINKSGEIIDKFFQHVPIRIIGNVEIWDCVNCKKHNRVKNEHDIRFERCIFCGEYIINM